MSGVYTLGFNLACANLYDSVPKVFTDSVESIDVKLSRRCSMVLQTHETDRMRFHFGEDYVLHQLNTAQPDQLFHDRSNGRSELERCKGAHFCSNQ